MSKNHDQNRTPITVAPVAASPIREGDATQAPIHSVTNTTVADDAKHRAYLEYVTAIDELASAFYRCFPLAGFSRETITELVMESKSNRIWKELSPKVKLCVVRLAMAMMPAAAVVTPTSHE